MAKQTIGIGAVANDGTGDALRTAMDKVNDNFDELYTATTNTQTSSYSLLLADNGKIVIVTTSGSSTLTVPAYATEAFPIGAYVVVVQGGAGQVTITAGSGVTILSADSALALTGQYATASLVKIATDTWLLTGSLE